MKDQKSTSRNYVLIGDGYELELRNLFAGFALAGLIGRNWPEKNIAEAAYRYADLMLEIGTQSTTSEVNHHEY